MRWSLPLHLYRPAVQTRLPFSHCSPSLCICRWDPFSCVTCPFFSFLLRFSSLAHSFHHFYLLTSPPPPPFLCNLSIPPYCNTSASMLILHFSPLSHLWTPSSRRSLPHGLPHLTTHPVSSFLHLSSFLHVSWYCRRVPDVPQTLFSTIKLLSLPSPAAARITWAEQALLNIEQRREGGTRRERRGARGEREEGETEIKMRRRDKKKRRSDAERKREKWDGRRGRGDGERDDYSNTQRPSSTSGLLATVATDSGELLSLGHE